MDNKQRVIEEITDKKILEEFLRKDTGYYSYHLGDLDDFFFPYTSWKGIKENEEIKALYMLYKFPGMPTLLAFCPPEQESYLTMLVRNDIELFPESFYSHLAPGLEEEFKKHYNLEYHGTHYKMAMEYPESLNIVDTDGVIRFNVENNEELKKFYDESYPGNWFDPRMLETGMYFGIKEDGRIISTAGVHVYSAKYSIAALGNITTAPEERSRGFGTKVTAKLCKELILKGIKDISLNVKDDNVHAIACYEKLGFKIIGRYKEYQIERKEK